METEIHYFINQIKQDIRQALDDKDYEKAICCSKFLCSFYYEYDYTYYDKEMEECAKRAAVEYIGNTIIDHPDRNKIFFYDKFGLIDRGLANIYVNSLLDLGYEVIWCLFENGLQVKQIVDRFDSKSNLSFAFIPDLSVVERMVFLKNIICKAGALHYFIYTLPTDVECMGVFASLQGDVKKYLINLTDHTFWIGADAIDYSIEFRNLGANISNIYRKIDMKKIRMLPYYPDERKSETYQGMPFSEEEEFVFSGGSAYKLEGSDIYEQIVCKILDKYPKLKFVFATNEKSEKLARLAAVYKGRFYVIKERSDLEEILKRAKFYLSTYPLGGGLLIQYALLNNCIPLCLTDKGNAVTNPKSWLLHPKKADFIFYAMNDLLRKVDELMARRGKADTDYAQCVISPSEFRRELRNILEGRATSYACFEEAPDMRLFHSYYEKRLQEQSIQDIIKQSRNKWIKEKYSLY